MKSSTPTNANQVDPDQVLVDIADYVLDYTVNNDRAFSTARLCATDTIASAFEALDFPDCTNLLGPIVPGTTVPHGARIPGTNHQLDPVNAAFSFGCMIRWLDLNDSFCAATGGHASDNLAGILMLADYLSRRRVAAAEAPLKMRDVLVYLIKAYEIQGCLAIENDFFRHGIDHDVMVRVASTAVLTHMLGGSREQIINAVSNAWIETSLVLYRHAPNAGSRKNWACGNASAQAVRLAIMSMKGEMGYPSVLTAKKFGFYETRFNGDPLKFQRPYGDYVIQNSMFKFIAAGMHSQSAIECAFRLHPLIKDRLNEVDRIEINAHHEAMRIMNKAGPLKNASDRDHCAQYVVALGLMHGKIAPQDFEDDFAADPRIDSLRGKMAMTEDPRYTKDFHDPSKRSSASAVRVFFKDGSSTKKIEIEYPVGHQRRRAEATSTLRTKLEASLVKRLSASRCSQIFKLYDNCSDFDQTPVHQFVEMLIPE